MAVSVVDIQVNSQGAVRSLQQLNAAVKGVTATIGSLAAALGAGFALQQVIRTASEFESTLSDIGKTAGSSQKDILKLADSLKQLSMPGRTNLAPSVLAKGVQDLVAQGLKLDDAVASIETLGKVAVATNSDLTDVTKTGFQLQSALKIKPTELKETFDALAFAGKAGAFELKDMAQFMPTIASAAASLGIQGKDGAVALASMMQMVRKDAPGAAEASTRLTDALLKMTAPESVRNFKKFGVDIEAVLKNAVKKGVNPMDAAIKELMRVTGNDPFKLSQIFGDKEAKLALMSLMKYREEYEKLKALAGGAAAAGTIQADFEASLKTFNQQLQSLTNAGEILALGLGNTLLPILARLIEEILPIVNGVAEFVKGIGQVPKPVIDAAIEIGKLVIQLTLVDKAIKIAMATAALFRGAMLLLATQTTLTGAAALTGQARLLMLASGITGAGSAAAVATPLIGAMALMLGRLAALGIVTVGINYVITQTGAISANIGAINKSEAAGTTKALTAQLKGKSAADRKIMLATTKKNLQNDQKLKERLELQIKAQEAASTDKPDPSQRTDLLAVQARINTNQQRIKAIQTFKIDTPKPAATPPPTPTPTPIPTGGITPKTKNKKERESQLADIQAANGLFDAQNRIQARIFEATLQENQAEILRLEYIQRGVELLAQSAEIQRSKDQQNEKEAKLKGVQDKLDASLLKYAQDSVKAVQDRVKPLQDIAKATQGKLQDDKEYQRLLAEGISPELAKQYIEIDKAYKLQQEKLPLEIQAAEAAILAAKARGEDVSGLERQLDSLKQAAGMARDQARSSAEQSDAVQKQKKQTEDLQSLYADLGMTIKSGVVDAIRGAVDGTKSLGEVASNVLNNIANKILDVAVNMALFGAMSGTGTGGGLLGGLFKPPGRAIGGPVSAGSSYMVGERGPELFTPKHGGSIIPNNALGGGSTNVVVNVDASGSSVQGDQAQSRQLGVAISAAVQAELVKQQRPGGLLATTRR